MSNKSKSGDFNLDEELLSKKAAIESGDPFSDERRRHSVYYSGSWL